MHEEAPRPRRPRRQVSEKRIINLMRKYDKEFIEKDVQRQLKSLGMNYGEIMRELEQDLPRTKESMFSRFKKRLLERQRSQRPELTPEIIRELQEMMLMEIEKRIGKDPRMLLYEREIEKATKKNKDILRKVPRQLKQNRY
ncbi:MAG: hypothetical protein PWP76_49 [Candidatus Diapherotrites archaeon]|nr:hypothetical protein [Candidatus Diapherotrites archaeon]MDN5366913.1 hypothetical protein [Candidatus Diapherotrites archaeon]